MTQVETNPWNDTLRSEFSAWIRKHFANGESWDSATMMAFGEAFLDARTRTPSPATGSAVPASIVAHDWKEEDIPVNPHELMRISNSCVGYDSITISTRMLCLLCDGVRMLWRANEQLRAITASPPSVSESTVAPSPVGEGQIADLQARLARKVMELASLENSVRHHLSDTSMGADIASILNNAMRCIFDTHGRWEAIAAQAPKPASGGGERCSQTDDGECVYRKTQRFMGDPRQSVSVACSNNDVGQNSIAAEADTAKCPHPRACEHHGCYGDCKGTPAADRLAQTVTDAEVESAAATIVCEGENVAWHVLRGSPDLLKDVDLESNADGVKRESAAWVWSRAVIRAAIEGFLRASESAPAQEGWVLVPREPTQAMLDAASAAQDRGDWIGAYFFARAWPHMIAAAPPAPTK